MAGYPGINVLKGCSCKYIQVTESFGVKFSNINNMTILFQRQLTAFQFGLAPYCFHSFHYAGYTCYITETAEIYCDPDEPCLEFGIRKLDKQANRLQKLLNKKAGFEFGDLHTGNVARLRNRMVCIDFGF